MAPKHKPKAYSFYRPHDKVTFGNELVDPFSGEISYPPSLTKQEHAKECDINLIVASFSVTQQWSHVRANAALGTYADLPDHLDLQEAENIRLQAEAAFMSLPAKVRDRFGSDVKEFLAFVSDPANQEEVYELGLADRPVPPPAPIDPPADPPKDT